MLELLTDQGSLPELLVCDGSGAAELMAPIAASLGIKLFVRPTPALDALKKELRRQYCADKSLNDAYIGRGDNVE